MQKKLLLFGGTGFLGSVVARKALLRGYTIVVATRSGVPDAGSPLEALARRARVVGGRIAALEAGKMGAVGLAGDVPIPSVSEEEKNPGQGKQKEREKGTRSDADSIIDYVTSAEADTHAIEFVSIDASNRQQVFHLMHDHPDTTAVVSTVGLLTRDYEVARQMNGDVNTNICAGVCHEKLVPKCSKFVYVSAVPYNKFFPRTIGSRRLLKGYYHGKVIAEKAVLENLGPRGVVLQPGMIYGTRFVAVPSATNEAGTVFPLPLGIIGKPLDLFLSALGGTRAFTPPVDVEAVAEAAVRVIDWAGLPELSVSGIIGTYDMKRIAAAVDPTLVVAAGDGGSGGSGNSSSSKQAESAEEGEEKEQATKATSSSS